jgi:cation diffusion facilitator family transporter
MDKTKAGYAEGVVSIAVNTALFALKFWAGMVTGSLALTADAWHTLSDSLSSILVVIAVRLASKKADKEHPFGHGRWEQIVALFIAFLLGLIAFDFLRGAVERFANKERAEFGTLAIIVTAVSIAVKELLAQFAFYIGKKTDSASVRADGWHHRTDMLSSAVVLAGIVAAKRFWWLDSALGAVIALMLCFAAYKILKEAITMLLGEEPAGTLVHDITQAVKAVHGGDLQLHHFHIHNYIVHKELTVHIRLDKDLSIETGHRIASSVETIIKDQFGIIATVHIEPLR